MLLDVNISAESYFALFELDELKKFVLDNLNYQEKDKLSSINEKILLLSKRNRP